MSHLRDNGSGLRKPAARDVLPAISGVGRDKHIASAKQRRWVGKRPIV
jgi:hypothetical protein